MLSVVDLGLMDYALPRANLAYATLKRDIQRHNPTFVLEEATVMKELEREGKLWMYESTDAKSGRMQDVKIWDGIWTGRLGLVTRKKAPSDMKWQSRAHALRWTYIRTDNR